MLPSSSLALEGSNNMETCGTHKSPALSHGCGSPWQAPLPPMASRIVPSRHGRAGDMLDILPSPGIEGQTGQVAKSTLSLQSGH